MEMVYELDIPVRFGVEPLKIQLAGEGKEISLCDSQSAITNSKSKTQGNCYHYIYTKNGQEITEEVFSYGTQFYPSGAAIVRNQQDKWGVLTTEGEFVRHEQWIDPMVDSGNERIIGFSRSNTTIFITGKNELEFVSAQGKIVATLIINKELKTAILLDAQQKTIAHLDYEKVLMPYLFFGSLGENYFPGDELSEAVNALIFAEPRAFMIVDKIFGNGALCEGEEYDFEEDEVDEDLIKYGAIKTIIESYLLVEECSEYPFLEPDADDYVLHHFKDISTRLKDLLGTPCDEKEEEYCKWQIAKGRGPLTLARLLNDGDGDFEKQLVLYVDDREIE
ncbi:hypothetical protein KUS10_000242 [Escherichia coli]|nr:hypothetical protein [Escherichia coli]